MNYSSDFYRIALTKINGVGAVTAKLLVSYTGSPQAVFEEKKSKLLKIANIGSETVQAIQSPKVFAKAEEELLHMNKNEIKYLFYLDHDYPSRLKNNEDAPILLYYKGNPEKIATRTVGIVGTRVPSIYGKMMTEKIVAELKSYDVSIISGLAHGIDAISHRASVMNEIPTFGIMGGGFENIYPAANRQLAMEMLVEGGILTEFGFKQLPDREHFPMRNRIIASLSDALIVVESGAVGGSIISARMANRYHKDVFAFPGKVNDPKSIGCNKLIKEHKANLIENVKDLSYIMGWDKKENEVQMSLPLEELGEDEKRIVSILSKNNEIHLDKIHHELSLPISSLSPLLLSLEFRGIVRSVPGKCFLLN